MQNYVLSQKNFSRHEKKTNVDCADTKLPFLNSKIPYQNENLMINLMTPRNPKSVKPYRR